MSRFLPAIVGGAFVGLTGTPALAQVLEAGPSAGLCVNGAVDTDRLAYLIVNDSRAATYAAMIDGSPDSLTSQEARTALAGLMAAGDPSTARPFGPAIDPTVDVDARAAIDRLVQTLRSQVLVLGQTPRKFGRTEYWLSASRPDAPLNPVRLFEADAALLVLCRPVSGSTGAHLTDSPQVTEDDSGTTGWSPRWRIRGAAADLGSQVAELSDVDGAALGYSRDGIAETETATLRAAVGYRFSSADGRIAATPFVTYDYKDTTGDEDVDTLSFGTLLSLAGAVGDHDLDAGLEMAWQIDRHHSAEQLKARFYLRPTIPLGEQDLFGQRFYADSGFWMFPELTLIGDISSVRDPGSNPAFAAGGDYRGYGVETSLRFGHVGSRYEGLSFSVGRRQLWLSGDLTIDEAVRRYAKLEYSFDDSPLGFAVTWSEGRNDDTFKPEDALEVQLTWRR